MSDFGTKFTASGITKLLDLLGDAITYTPVGGAAVSRRAIYNRQVFALDVIDDAYFTMSTDATSGVASPREGDKITYSGDVWVVVDARVDQDGAAELFCKKAKAIT